jgi:hypothetical protein
MFTPEEREVLKQELIVLAQADPRISGGALTGSATLDKTDEWSDIDLAFGIANPEDLQQVLQDLTHHLTTHHQVVDTLDVPSGNWIYRVFFLANTLQIDLAFAPKEDFRALAPTFNLLFGEANDPVPTNRQDPHQFIGWGWPYALHARSSLRRNKPWQAAYMIEQLRNQTIALACLRNNLPTRDGRGVDRLPSDFKEALNQTLIPDLQPQTIQAAFQATTALFLEEIAHTNPALKQKLQAPLTELAGGLLGL